MAEQKNTRTIVLALILVVAVAGAGAYMMMPSSSQESTATTEVTAKPIVENAVATAEKSLTPARPSAPLPAEEAPLTLTALQYMPEDTHMAVGIPAVTSLLAKTAPLVQELFQDELNVTEEIALIARDLAKDMEVEESDDLAAVLLSMGIDSAQGIALFLNLDALVDVMLESMASGSAPGALPDMSTVKALAVIPVTDGEKAEASLKKITDDLLVGVTTSEETEGDVVITVYEGVGAYFVTDTVLAISTNVEMLKEAAAREGAPATLRYGSTSCPPDDIHEAAMLIHIEKLIPLAEKFTELMAQLQPDTMAGSQAQMTEMKKMFEGSSGDPLLTTFSIRSDVIELKSKIDTDAYPALLKSVGTAQPLRWAQLLPKNTLALLALTLTPEAKEQIKDVYLANLPAEIMNIPSAAMAMGYAGTVLDILGREITLAITDMEPLDFPSIFLSIEIADMKQASIFLPMIPQIPQGDPYRDVQIKAIDFPSPIQFFFAIIDSAIVISNSEVGMQEIIDLVKDEETSGLFETLEPPIDPEIPIYQMMLLKPELYLNLIGPLSEFAGQPVPAADEVTAIFQTLDELFCDIRCFSEMEDSWLTSRVSIIRTPIN